MSLKKEICDHYHHAKPRIKRRLKDFHSLKNASPEKIFEELCFCLLTPQSKALACDGIIRELKKRGLLLRGTRTRLYPLLKKTRFYRKKTEYLLLARKLFFAKGSCSIKKILKGLRPQEARALLVRLVKGLGYKEASHFLRNIGRGQDLAILDVHVLRRLQGIGLISKVPASLSPKEYFRIEGVLKRWSRKTRIPMDQLDLVLWSMGTGMILK